MSNFRTKANFEDFTEQEFLDFLYEIYDAPLRKDLTASALEKHIADLIESFEAVTQHPKGSDVIFYPESGNDGTPEGILEEIKRWREQAGLSGFRQ